MYKSVRRRNDRCDSRFSDITLNGTGRPVRAIVSECSVDCILNTTGRITFDMVCTDVLRSFGDVFDRHPAPMRKRSYMSVNELGNVLKRFGDKHEGAVSTVYELESRIKQELMNFYPNGISYGDGSGRVYNRSYQPSDYKIIFAGLFIDPPGSAAQSTHEDVSAADRDAVWNIVLPVELDEPYVIAFSESGGVHKGGREVGLREAAMWDAGWPHRGLGNDTQKRRVFLHLVFAPYWMVSVRVTTKGLDFGNMDNEVQQTLRSFDGVDVDFISRLHGKVGCSKHASSISKEYNDGRDVHDSCGPMISWVHWASVRRTQFQEIV